MSEGEENLFQPSVQTLPQKNGESIELVELRTGWMVKEGNVRHSWKRRFFVLHGGALLGRLDYFKGERSGWKGALSLIRAEPAETIVTPPKAKGLYCFHVRTPNREWIFGADSEDDRSIWIAAINSVIAHLKDPSLGPISLASSIAKAQQQNSSLVIFSNPNATKEDGSAPGTASDQVKKGPAATPEYMLLDPQGDRRRHEQLKKCSDLKSFIQREQALKGSSRDLIPLGRLLSVSCREEQPKTEDSTAGSAPAPAAAPAPAVDDERAIKLSEVLVEWGNALVAHAKKVAEKKIEVLDNKGHPVLMFEYEEDDGNGNVQTVERDARYVMLAFSEAFDKAVSGTNRRHLSPDDVERCKSILDSWAAFLREISATNTAEALAVGLHPRLGAESPLSVLSPELAKMIALWAVPMLALDKQMRTPLLERRLLAQMAVEKSFMSRHIQRLLDRGPIRFGFMTVRAPVEVDNDFARKSGRFPPGAYLGALPEGRLFCELTHESLCFTSPGDGDEVVVPLLWIRRLDIESTSACFLKFTRYVVQPSSDATLESRILYADNSPETYAWLSDIARAFSNRRKNG